VPELALFSGSAVYWPSVVYSGVVYSDPYLFWVQVDISISDEVYLRLSIPFKLSIACIFLLCGAYGGGERCAQGFGGEA
jgi:hypothetical protein